jgi:integrase
MEYLLVTDKFLKEYPDYRHDIKNFNEYLELQWKGSLSDETLRFMIQGIDVDFILHSLIYNVETIKKYKSKTTAKRYATVIGQFFNYIRRTTDIDNPSLYDAISYNRLRENTYMKRMMSYIDTCNALAGIVEQVALKQTDVEIILKWVDKQFEERGWEDSTQFKKAMASIGIKMMLLYGITYRELRKIKWNDYDEVYGNILINGFNLRLPAKLSVQIKQLKHYIVESGIKNEKNIFFTDSSGEQWAEITSYSGIPDYLGALIGTTSVTSIVKYGISQLLKAGLSDSIVKKLTGASDKLIQGCILHEDYELNRIVNNKIVTTELYYEF